MSEVKVNKISPRSGTGVQLGDSGDTITIPAGANATLGGAEVTCFVIHSALNAHRWAAPTILEQNSRALSRSNHVGCF